MHSFQHSPVARWVKDIALLLLWLGLCLWWELLHPLSLAKEKKKKEGTAFPVKNAALVTQRRCSDFSFVYQSCVVLQNPPECSSVGAEQSCRMVLGTCQVLRPHKPTERSQATLLLPINVHLTQDFQTGTAIAWTSGKTLLFYKTLS